MLLPTPRTPLHTKSNHTPRVDATPLPNYPPQISVYCSGLTVDFSKLIPLEDAFDPKTGYPLQTDGESDNHPGLFFLGLHWMRKWKSAILLGNEVPDVTSITAK